MALLIAKLAVYGITLGTLTVCTAKEMIKIIKKNNHYHKTRRSTRSPIF